MHQRLKERLVGAAVLVVLAVIFIPMILTGPVDSGAIKGTNIPEKPDKTLKPALVPITDSTRPEPTGTADDRTPAATSSEPQASIEPVTTVPESPKVSAPATTDNVAQSAPETSTGTAKSATGQPQDKAVGLSAWVVQLGSFASKVNADKLNLRLRKAGFPAFVEPIEKDDKTVYRVRVGPELLRSDADKLLADISARMKLEGIVLRYP